MELTDTALIEKWKTFRDPDAFTELVARHSAMVYRVACRILRDPGCAEEVAQECFIILAQKPVAIRRSLAGWLHELAVSRALDRLKTERRRLARESRYAQQANTVCKPQWDDLQGYVDEAVVDLPDILRETVVYRYLEGHSLDETAQHLSVSRSTVQNRLEKAVGEIRRFLKHRGVVVPAGALIASLGVESAEAAPATLTLALGKLALAGTTGSTTFSAGSGVVLTGGLLVMKKVLIVVGILVLVSLLAGMMLFKTAPPPSEASPATPVVTPEHSVPVKQVLPATDPAPTPQPSNENSIVALLTQMLGGQDSCSISGIVVDAKERPLGDMMVYYANAKKIFRKYMIATEADGRFEIKGLAPGKYSLFPRKRFKDDLISESDQRSYMVGLNEKGTLLELSPDQHLTGVKLVYDRPWTISGRIMDSEGKPVSNIRVGCTAEKNGGTFAFSGADGAYMLEGLVDDSYHVFVREKGYPQLHILAKAGQNDVDFTLIPSKTLNGLVLDAATDLPIQKFNLGLDYGPSKNKIGLGFDSSMEIQDSNGRFTLPLDTKLELTVCAQGYTTETQLVTKEILDNPQEMVFRMVKGGGLCGFVRDKAGHPISDAEVFYGLINEAEQIKPLFKPIKTGSNGAFVLTEFPRKAQLISVSHPSYAVNDIMISENADLSKPITIVLTSGGGLRGKINTDGSPEGSMTNLVLSYRNEHSEQTDSYQRIPLPIVNGTFESLSLKPGKATLNVSRLWKSVASEQRCQQELSIPVMIEEGKVNEINIDFQFATGVIEGSVPVLVQERTTKGIFDLKLNWYGPSGTEIYEPWIDPPSGKYRIEGVSPGRGTLECTFYNIDGLQSNSVLLESIPITLSKGQVFHHDFTATPEAQ